MATLEYDGKRWKLTVEVGPKGQRARRGPLRVGEGDELVLDRGRG